MRALQKVVSLIVLCSLFPVSSAFAQLSGPGPSGEALAGSILQDINGDGVLRIAAFGDSITRGVGDFNGVGENVTSVQDPSGEAGYPLRLEGLLGVGVSNLGDPGERLASAGLDRFASSIPGAGFDIIIVSGGSNDAIELASTGRIFRTYQTIVNIARASGTEVVLATITPTCCDHFSLERIIESYNEQIRVIAAVNATPLADINLAYKTTCNLSSCYLLNLPEGLHPNIAGYDVSGEVVTSALLGIDIFAADGALLLEQALNLPEGSVTTRPVLSSM